MSEKVQDLVSKLKRYPISGFVAAALCGLLFTLSNYMAQVSMIPHDNQTVPSTEIVFFRSTVQLLLLIPVILISRLSLLIQKGSIFSAVCMSIGGLSSIVFVFLALEVIPVADVLVITFTSPVFTAALAYFILKEKLHWFDIVCGFISFVGVVLVARPTFIFGSQTKKYDLIGPGFALLGGICLALYFVLSKKFANESRGILNVFYPSALGVILSPIIGVIIGHKFIIPGSWKTILASVSVGIFSTLGLALLTLSLKLENATFVMLVRNLDAVYAFVLQYIGLDIKPPVWSIGGAALIMLAASAMAIRRQYFEDKSNKECEYTAIDEENEIEHFLFFNRRGEK